MSDQTESASNFDDASVFDPSSSDPSINETLQWATNAVCAVQSEAQAVEAMTQAFEAEVAQFAETFEQECSDAANEWNKSAKIFEDEVMKWQDEVANFMATQKVTVAPTTPKTGSLGAKLLEEVAHNDAAVEAKSGAKADAKAKAKSDTKPKASRSKKTT